MIVLSNIYDSACVRWITENVPENIEIVDWYRDRDAWVASGGTVRVSAFPSVVHRDGSVQCLPETWAEVIAYDATVPPGWTLIDGVWTAPPVLEPLPPASLIIDP